jgi:hypothetical protein
MAVDAASPVSPITVEAGNDVVTAKVVDAGAYDGAAKIVSGLRRHALVYAKSDGRIYRTSALKSGSLAPVQVSSENNAHRLCDSVDFLAPDFANSDNAQYVYRLGDASGACDTANDEWKMVRLRMGAGDAPIAAKRPLAVLGDLATGAIAGWLVFDGTVVRGARDGVNGDLRKCDANFANCGASLFKVVGSSLPDFVRLGLGLNRFVLELGGQLFVYDGNTGMLSAPVFTIPSETTAGPLAADRSHVYFANVAVRSRAGAAIYKFPIDASASASMLAAEADSIGTQMDTTASKVIYAAIDAGLSTSRLKAVDKSAGTVATLAETAGAYDGFFFVSGNVVYYTFQGLGGRTGTITPVLAGMVDENGANKSALAGAGWYGWIYPDAADLSLGASGYRPKTMIRVEGYAGLGSGLGFAGGALTSFDSATGTQIAALGTLPAEAAIAAITCFGYGDSNGLCSVATQPGRVPVQTDIFFIDALTAGSLLRVTNTADKSETPL